MIGVISCYWPFDDLAACAHQLTIFFWEKVNVATPPMTVNPWDESHQLDLLERLRPQIKDYEVN